MAVITARVLRAGLDWIEWRKFNGIGLGRIHGISREVFEGKQIDGRFAIGLRWLARL